MRIKVQGGTIMEKHLFSTKTAALVLLLAAGCASQGPTQPPAAAETSPAKTGAAEAGSVVVARVNGAEITMATLVTMMNRIGSAGTAEETAKKALDRLIFRELAWQKASTGGIVVDRNNVDAAITNLKENLGGEQAYREHLSKENVTEPELRSQIERSLAIELIYAREVLAKVTIPEADVKREYEREKHRYVLPEKATVVDVMCLPGKDGKESRAAARGILRKLQADPDRNPWNLVLDGTFIVRKIDGCNGKHADICAAARKLAVNGLSGVISAADGRHIVKLLSYTPQRQLSFEETKASLEGKFKVAAQDRRMQEWESELRKDAALEIIDSAIVVETPQERKEISSAR